MAQSSWGGNMAREIQAAQDVLKQALRDYNADHARTRRLAQDAVREFDRMAAATSEEMSAALWEFEREANLVSHLFGGEEVCEAPSSPPAVTAPLAPVGMASATESWAPIEEDLAPPPAVNPVPPASHIIGTLILADPPQTEETSEANLPAADAVTVSVLPVDAAVIAPALLVIDAPMPAVASHVDPSVAATEIPAAPKKPTRRAAVSAVKSVRTVVTTIEAVVSQSPEASADSVVVAQSIEEVSAIVVPVETTDDSTLSEGPSEAPGATDGFQS